MARVVPLAREDAVVTYGGKVQSAWEYAHESTRDSVLALLRTRGVTDFDPKDLRWEERALFVADPVYVLGPADVAVGPPVAHGYRSSSSTQLVLRGTPGSPLTIAGMTEERFVAELKGSARRFFGCATFVAIFGLIVAVVALATTWLDCNPNSD